MYKTYFTSGHYVNVLHIFQIICNPWVISELYTVFGATSGNIEYVFLSTLIFSKIYRWSYCFLLETTVLTGLELSSL